MTTFNFPTVGIDIFTPSNLINDLTVVNALHVSDLRQSIIEIEKALIGATPLSYTNTNIIQDGYNIRLSLETLDYYTYSLGQQLGFIFNGFDGYLSRIDQIEGEFKAHRSENSDTDAYGYNVHGVIGSVVGTDNQQALTNKKLDSGTAHIGPKLITRSSLADSGNHQIEVYNASGALSAWVDEQGNAYFNGDLSIGGDGYIIDFQRITKHLIVDGYTIFGDDPSLDYTTITGPLTVKGTIALPTLDITASGNITGNGSNVTLGDSTGLLDLNFASTDVSGDAYIHGTLTASGPVNLGDTVGTDIITIKGTVLHTFGDIYSSGGFRTLGTKFRVESDTTTIDTSQLTINSLNTTMGGIFFDGYNGNITADGYSYSFGYYPSRATNSFVVNATTQIEDLTIVNDIQVATGTITTSNLVASAATIAGPLVIQDSSEGTIGDVWTSQDASGTGAWQTFSVLRWRTLVTNGLTVTTTAGTTPLVPTGFYDALDNDEIFVNTAGGPFTINLPASPLLGARMRFIDHNGSWSSINRAIIFPRSTNIIKTFTSPADVSIAADTIIITSHGLVTGNRGTLTTTGSLPGGLTTSTDFFVIVVNSNTIRFATSLANAQSNIFINLTSLGSGVQTFTTGTIQGAAFLELDVPGGWAEIMFNGVEWRVIS
jgi:hypothetical protein